MSKQISAVEWLAEKYNCVTWMRNRDEISAGLADEWRKHYLEQAKELEKQQHEKTWFDSTMQFANESEMINKKYFDDYYTETFNQ